MDARTVDRIERSVDYMASAFLAGAVGFAAYVFLRPYAGLVQLRLLASLATLGSFTASELVLRALSRRKPSFAPALFDLRELELLEPDELVLGAKDRFHPEELLLTDEQRIDALPVGDTTEPLVLDDVLAKLGPDSRVVRLFDRSSMPTPGQLQSRIEDHLGNRQAAITPDASQALSEALAELRRSLR